MNENLRAKIVARLEGLSDEHGRQLLDYLEFLLSKYNQSRRAASPLKRFAESLEDALGGTSLTDTAAKGTAQVVDAAGRVMAGLSAAGRAVADELAGTPEEPEPVSEGDAEEAKPELKIEHGGHNQSA